MTFNSLIRKNVDPLVRKLALGTVQFGLDYGISNRNGITSPEEVRRILYFCDDIGIDTLDTAYGYGESETVLGQNNLKSFRVITKFLSTDMEIPNFEIQIKESLRRLNLKSTYGILAHRPMDILMNPEKWDYLQLMKRNGVVDKIGFSFNDPSEVSLVIEKGFIPDLVQAPFNFFDNRFSKYLMLLKEKHRTEIHTRSTFLQGLFFMNPIHLSHFFDPIKDELTQLQGNCKSLSGSLLKYVLNQSFVDKVVMGINSLDQLDSNIKSLEIAEPLDSSNLIKYPEEILTPSKWPQLPRN